MHDTAHLTAFRCNHDKVDVDLQQHNQKENMMALSFRRLIIMPAVLLALLIGFVLTSSGADASPRYYNPPGGGVYEQVAADLVVTSTSQGYSRYGGYYTDAVVVNQGNAAAGSFYVGNNGSYLPVSGLNAGASTVVRFYRGSYCETGGTVMADAFNQVYERYEGNNSRSWSIIC